MISAKKLALVHAEKERREFEIISSKRQQLRTVRGKLTRWRLAGDMNSHQIEEKEATDNELIRLQTGAKP